MAKRTRLSFETWDGKTFKLSLPEKESRSVVVPNQTCKACGAALEVHGMGKRIHAFDIYSADAKCTHCGADVGRLFLKVPTLFGIAEDEAVLNRYLKIY